MQKNTITASVEFINGGYSEFLSQASPAEAIETYLYPTNKPVALYKLIITDDNGKTITIGISKQNIIVSDFF